MTASTKTFAPAATPVEPVTPPVKTEAIAAPAGKTATKPATKPALKAPAARKAALPTKPTVAPTQPVAAKRAATAAKTARPATKKAVTAQPAKPAPAVKPKAKATPVKPAKVKMVRDSFTMPREEFEIIDRLKMRALDFRRPTKKSEVLRAGVRVLMTLNDAQLQAALDGLTPIKAGRPKKT